MTTGPYSAGDHQQGSSCRVRGQREVFAAYLGSLERALKLLDDAAETGDLLAALPAIGTHRLDVLEPAAFVRAVG